MTQLNWSNLKKIASNERVLLLASELIPKAAGLVNMILITNGFGVSVYGEYLLATSMVLLIVPLGRLGAEKSILILPETITEKVHISSHILLVLLASIGAFLIFQLVLTFSQHISPAYSGSSPTEIIFFTSFALLFIVGEVLGASLYKEKAYFSILAANIFPSLLALSFLVLIITFDLEIALIGLLLPITYFSKTLICSYFFRTKISYRKISFSYIFKDLSKLNLRFLLISIFGAVTGQIDKLVTGLLISTEVLGIYGIALQLCELLKKYSTSRIKVYSPILLNFSFHSNSKFKKEIARIYRTEIPYLLLFALISIFMAVVVSRYISVNTNLLVTISSLYLIGRIIQWPCQFRVEYSIFTNSLSKFTFSTTLAQIVVVIIICILGTIGNTSFIAAVMGIELLIWMLVSDLLFKKLKYHDVYRYFLGNVERVKI